MIDVVFAKKKESGKNLEKKGERDSIVGYAYYSQIVVVAVVFWQLMNEQEAYLCMYIERKQEEEEHISVM